MGGGGAMRAAAKMAGFTVANSGRRMFTGDQHPVSSAIRRANANHPAEDVKLVVSQTHGVQKPAISEMDDWVFTDGEQELGDPMPRLVFGAVPTMEEAKEATFELADALEKTYLSSPKSVGSESVFSADLDSSSLLSNSQVLEDKTCVANDAVSAPALPNHAIKAFKFLHESSAAQTVVASIACDQNVWNAVLQNPELQEFMQSQLKYEYEGDATVTEVFDESSTKSFGESSEIGNSDPEPEGFMDFVQKIKSSILTSVVDMMNSLSGFFKSFFEGQGFNKIFVGPDGNAKVSADTVMEASFMGLAVMAIMVVLLKRA